MKITGNESEKAVLREMGERIRECRVALNFTQIEFADQCGISTSTVVRIEAGDDSKLSNYIKILSALDMLANINLLIPETKQDFKLLFENKHTRKRVRKTNLNSSSGWVWGEDKE